MKSTTLEIKTPGRLDLALAEAMGISRSQAQKLVKEGRVSVSGKKASPHLEVTAESHVEVSAPPAKPRKKAAAKLDIIFEDDDVIVVNKPAGILVHRAEGQDEPALLDSLLKHSPKMKKAGAEEKRSGIVHRLDKEASGVLIAAKTPKAFTFLKEQFKERLTEKHYTVLVMGKMKDEVGTINFPIARSTTRARMAARPTSQEGKDAITHYTVIGRYSVGTLLDVHIETGRTHQIRAHMFAIGYPVAGDTLYKRKDIKPIVLPRLFLHARSLTITLPSGERKTFEAPLPKELKDALDNLKPEHKT
jgi:23S rRNA pseudouridine1911/1915/1917 synthase